MTGSTDEERALRKRLGDLLRGRSEGLEAIRSRPVARIWLATDPDEINRLTLNHAHSTMGGEEGRSWALLSAAGPWGPRLEEARTLRHELDSNRLAYLRLACHVGDRMETACWVRGITARQAFHTAACIGMAAALYCGPETGHGIAVFTAAARILEMIHIFDPAEIAREVSRVRHRRCWYEYRPHSMAEACLRREIRRHRLRGAGD